MRILVANLGSTSLKWRLFDMSNGQETMLHRGGLERVEDHGAAIGECLAELKSAGHITGEGDIAAVGFKTVHAKDVSGCVRLDESVLAAMEAFNQLAPAHNPPYIAGIRTFSARMPGTPLIGLFESSFYQWVPEAATRYAVPAAWHEAGIRRYGFHGASHKFIAERSAELLGRNDVAARTRNLYVDNGASPIDGPDLRVISFHLGGSSSVTGIRNGVAVGTSMGFSPQSGLPQNNRVGDLDSFAVPYAMRALGLSLDEVEKQLCSEAGLKGVSGVSNDIRDILAASKEGDSGAQLAIDVLVHAARHWLGAFLAELNGAEALVFTAGIAENNPELRAAICANLDGVGIELDEAKNGVLRAEEGVISADESRVQVLVIPTNEELVVAREVKRFLERTNN